jgi:cytochrome c biogenesis protein CcmG, thiol:disulfide interchange protein DsbE
VSTHDAPELGADRDSRDDMATDRRRTPVAPFIALAVAVVMAGLFVVLAGADPTQNREASTYLLGRPAPEATGELADGSTFELSRRKGSWVVVNFFTSWCIPCKREHPELIEFVEQQRALGNEGAEFYQVVVDDDRDAVEAFFANEGGGDWPVVYDHDGRFAVAFGVAQVPETWIIDPNGVVQRRLVSEVTADFLGQQLQRFREEL